MAIETDSRSQLGDLFGDSVRNNEDVMAECLSMLRIYNLSPSDLFYKYEAFLLARPSGLRAKLAVLTVDTARELRRELQRAQQVGAAGSSSASTPRPEAKTTLGMRKGKGGHDIGGLLNGLAGTPSTSSTPTHGGNLATPVKTPTPASPSHYRPPVTSHLDTPVARKGSTSGASSPTSDIASPGMMETRPFRSRLDPHSLVESLNSHLPQLPVPTSSRPRVVLSAHQNPKDWDYRYMFEKISQRSEMLDREIDDFGDLIREAYGLRELGDPHFATDDSMYTVGRILSPPTDISKATATSLVLESSRLLGSGRRLPLRFPPGRVKVRGGAPGFKSLSLFPGCMVCVKGRNGGGGFFAVEEVLLSIIEDLVELQHGDRTQGGPVSVHVATGPFTLDDDLDFEPLRDLCRVAESERPDVLVLLGPFVDAHHPVITSGSTTRHPNDIFRDEITSQIVRLTTISPSTTVILVPSVRDIVNQHVAYPQAMLDKEALGLPKKVKCLPNPCTFAVNEVVLGISTVDVLFHLRREEVSQPAEAAELQSDSAAADSKDPMAGLVRHILGQRNFYPLFPPPENLAADVNLDISHLGLLKMENSAPDVLILPSRLKHFSKVVDSTLVVNPGSLCRARTAGTFAKLQINPFSRTQLDARVAAGEDMMEHDIWDRTKAEIWRI